MDDEEAPTDEATEPRHSNTDDDDDTTSERADGDDQHMMDEDGADSDHDGESAQSEQMTSGIGDYDERLRTIEERLAALEDERGL